MLCAVGDLVEDVVVLLDGPPARGTDTTARISRHRGGSAANVAIAAAAASREKRSRFIGHVGADDLGDRLLTELAAAGVDLAVTRGGHTGSIVVLVDPDGERTMLTDRGASPDLSVVDAAWIDGVTVVHIPAYSLAVQPLAGSARRIASLAHRHGVPVSVDASSTAVLEEMGVDLFRALVDEIEPEVLFANADEAALLGLSEDASPTSVDLTVVKRGAAPTLLRSAAGDVLEVGVETVDGVVDTTGAGDAYAAGFLVASLGGGVGRGRGPRRPPPGGRLPRENRRMTFAIDPEVAAALDAGRAIVAMESTIFSRLGLPSPANRDALDRCLASVRNEGAVPAVTAVVDGVARVGLDDSTLDRVLDGTRKCAARDVPVAIAQRWDLGATTVSASLLLATRAGIRAFATGGIGGVHRNLHETHDVSADLDAIARFPVVTVSAGAKAFLDLGRTLEHLETAGVPVLGLGTDDFPAFYARSSGLPVPHRVDSVEEAAAVVNAARAVGYQGGVLLAVPIPEADAIPRDVLDRAIAAAVAASTAAGATGPAVTPFVLERIVAATGGRSVDANLALAANNAGVAARLALALAG